jgi:hypothetical protein
MDKLVSNRGSNEISLKVLDVLRHLCIEDWQSEPYFQQQNFAKRRYQLFKDCVNRVMDRSGAPPKCWLLCCQYVASIHKYTQGLAHHPELLCFRCKVNDKELLDNLISYGHILKNLESPPKQPQ